VHPESRGNPGRRVNTGLLAAALDSRECGHRHAGPPGKLLLCPAYLDTPGRNEFAERIDRVIVAVFRHALSIPTKSTTGTATGTAMEIFSVFRLTILSA